ADSIRLEAADRARIQEMWAETIRLEQAIEKRGCDLVALEIAVKTHADTAGQLMMLLPPAQKVS
ncbi:MAG TPA: hypothetical protein VLW85_22555, partial [Myxococcales bacterium]|nr:hypothetical protein [Myxococcales bacterium]